MKAIRSISALSVFKISCVVYALLFACLGCLGFVLPMSVAGSLFTRENLLSLNFTNEQATAIMQNLGVDNGTYLVTVIGGYVVGLVLVPLISAILFAIAALLYNIIARIVGGVEVHIE
jgi:hypothetical protein